MRALNTLKNRRIQKYDYAFKEMVQNDELDDTLFIKEVRRTFFDLLKPMLTVVESEKCIDRTKKGDDTDTVFSKYFDKEKYKQFFKGETAEAFAKELVETSQF